MRARVLLMLHLHARANENITVARAGSLLCAPVDGVDQIGVLGCRRGERGEKKESGLSWGGGVGKREGEEIRSVRSSNLKLTQDPRVTLSPPVAF